MDTKDYIHLHNTRIARPKEDPVLPDNPINGPIDIGDRADTSAVHSIDRFDPLDSTSRHIRDALHHGIPPTQVHVVPSMFHNEPLTQIIGRATRSSAHHNLPRSTLEITVRVLKQEDLAEAMKGAALREATGTAPAHIGHLPDMPQARVDKDEKDSKKKELAKAMAEAARDGIPMSKIFAGTSFDPNGPGVKSDVYGARLKPVLERDRSGSGRFDIYSTTFR